MKKLLLSLAAVITCCMSIQSANVIVKMNSTSPWMNLVDKATGDTIDVGGAVNKTYTFDVPEGVYVLTALAKDSSTVNGTIELDVQSVPSDSTRQFSILTNTVYATNKNDDKTAWEVGKDYTIAVDVSTREGERMVVTLGNSVTAGRKTFLALNGNSYYVSLIPSEERQAEGYMTNERSGTLTAGITVSGAIPMGGEYIVTLPADAELFIGKKFSHFTNFAKVEPSKTEVDGNSKKVYYRLADNQVYNFRTWKSGGLTQGGYFTMDIDAGENSYLKFSDSSYEAFGPKTIKHDVNWNGGYETGNIFVNINERGHLQLSVGETFHTLPIRSWQLTDTQTNNYFLEPDFHYTVIDLDGNPSTGVIEIDNAHTTTAPWSTIKAVGNGTAIVLVTYDAIALNYYKYNTKADSLTKTNYMGGEYWGAIWPENTAAYVVTVGEGTTAMQPNMYINEAYNEGALKTAGKYVDAEHDVFYYLDTEEGATYTFTPTGVDHIEMAYPTIGEQIATYHGFGTEGVCKNEDGSYTLLLKEGRQIVKMTDAGGNSIYQVLTAKPCHREITNASREGSTIFQPGDKVKIQYSGLHHPANKLAGIYNMSAYVTYNNIPNGSSLILGAGQYTFASAPTAQMVTVDIPADYTSEELVMNQGVIQVNGFGDPIGAHRSINKNLGRSPNFTAIAHKTYFGQLPEVRIPITETKYFVINLQSDVDSIQYTITQEGDTLRPDANGIYAATYGTYIIKASKPGYRCFRTTLTIADDAEGEQTCIIEMVKAADNAWDGTTLTEPRCEDDIYQISSGAELAWFAAKVNGGDYKLSAKLVSDIDLCGHDWTPIGGSKSNTAYQGSFAGDGHTINGLYINNTLTYQALFGYTTNSHISGITVSGEVNAKQYVAGVVAFMGPKATVDRCANKAKVTGTSTYVGGITGSVSQATSTLTNSYNLGDITGTTNCGGIAGYNHKNAVIENAFSLGTVTGTKVAACIGGTTAKDKAQNIFATQEYDIILGQSTVTSDQMASGELAYLLGEAFGQKIGIDTHPVLGGERVYKVTYTTNLSADVDSLYTNGALPQFDDVEGHQTIWKTSLDGEELTEVSADSTLYVEYHKITYALTYVVDGEVYATDSIEYGAAITLMDEPVKEGYTFSGWSEVPETMPASDVTISGTYTVNNYTVTFKIGDEVIFSESMAYGTAIVAPEAPEVEGKTFAGWGEVAATVPANDVTYEGTYTVNVYNVYYYVGDELVHTAEVAYGETIPEYVYEPTTEGDEFLGWIGDTYETMPAHDVTYTANIESDVLQLTIHNSQLTIHDLSGRKVTDTENLKRGIYIVNGKKVIVK
ncbi:MAG: InlB B-repeat-containing protein [Bacteroidaceae bacterium]|nr:InlB B-repeat-containing protein [Bacteroidaceae bacterium]